MNDGTDATVMALIEITIVPSNRDVGVIVKLSVVVVVGPNAPLAVIPAMDWPPKAIVNDPAVRRVTV
jgi:hypothetical protein